MIDTGNRDPFPFHHKHRTSFIMDAESGSGESKSIADIADAIQTTKTNRKSTLTIGQKTRPKTRSIGKQPNVRRGHVLPPADSPAKNLKKDGTPKKPYRFRPGTVALRNVIRSMAGRDEWAGKNAIRTLPFQRLVREICQNVGKDDIRFEKRALKALQEGAEAEMVDVFENGMFLAAMSKRVTLKPKDMRVALYADRGNRSRYFGRDKLQEPVKITDDVDLLRRGTNVLVPTML